MVILDSSFIIAKILADDPNHEISQRRMTEFFSKNEVFLVNNFVVSEICTLSSLRLRNFKEILKNYVSDLIEGKVSNTIFVHITEEEYQKALLLAFTHGISFTDASLIILAESYESSRVFTHDKELVKVLKYKGIQS